MTEQPKDGGAAFPTGLTPGHYSQEGMSLRDWFAGQALAGIVGGYYANPELSGLSPRDHAEESYLIADAMIAAREATK